MTRPSPLLVIFCVRFARLALAAFRPHRQDHELAAPAVLYAAAALAIGRGGLRPGAGLHRHRADRRRRRAVSPGGGATPACCCWPACGVAGLRLRDQIAHRGADNNPVYPALRGPALHCPGRGCRSTALCTPRRRWSGQRRPEDRVARKSEALRVVRTCAPRDAAQAADRAKSRFLAAASHDLRQPVHAIGLSPRARYRPQRCRRPSATRWRAWAPARAGAMFDALLTRAWMPALPCHGPSPSISTRDGRLATSSALLAEGTGCACRCTATRAPPAACWLIPSWSSASCATCSPTP